MNRQRGAPKRRTPNTLVEVLRLLTVVFFIGLGVEVGQVSTHHLHNISVGPFRGAALGVIVGSGIGYVLGGILGRTAATTADRTEAVLRQVSADTLVAGSFGGLVGGLIAVVISWPLFFIPGLALAVSLFAIVVVLLAYVGFRVGAAKRDEVLGVIGFRTGVLPRRPSGSALVKLLDTSVAIDGRIVDVVRAGFLHGKVVVIQPVLDELDRLAKLSDPHRRARGRRGLEVLETLQREPFVDIDVISDPQPDTDEVDLKLVRVCLDYDYALLTLDTNLAKSAAISGVSVLNLHALSLALRPLAASPGSGLLTGSGMAVLLKIRGGRDARAHLAREPARSAGRADAPTLPRPERPRYRRATPPGKEEGPRSSIAGLLVWCRK